MQSTDQRTEGERPIMVLLNNPEKRDTSLYNWQGDHWVCCGSMDKLIGLMILSLMIVRQTFNN